MHGGVKLGSARRRGARLCLLGGMMAGCGPAGLGEVGGVLLPTPQAAVVAYHQDGRGMVLLSDLPDLCALLAEAPSDPPTADDFYVLSVLSLEPLQAGVAAPAESYARLVVGGEVVEHAGETGSLLIQAQDAQQGTGRLVAELGEDRVQAGFMASLCASSALFIGKE